MADKTYGKFLDYSGVEILWEKIRKLLDRKLESVINHDETIEVTSGREIAVKISSAEGNLLEVKHGLYVAAPVLHKLTFGSDKQYIYDGTEDVTVPVYNGEYYKE